MAKGTKFKFPPFTKLMNPGLRIYPGAFIPVGGHYDILIMDDVVTDQAKPLPPGVPLDEDIFDKLLQNILLWKEFALKYNTVATLQARNELMEKLTRNTQLAFMETLWRQIKRKKEQACSAT